MIWKTTGRVQNVSALFCQGEDFSPILDRLMSGPKAYQDIELAQGENWHVIFGARYNSEEVLLPHIAQAKPLFQAFPHIWMAVGTAFNLPAKVEREYIDTLRSDHHLEGRDLILIPQFSNDADMTDKADIFVIEQRLAISELALATAG